LVISLDPIARSFERGMCFYKKRAKKRAMREGTEGLGSPRGGIGGLALFLRDTKHHLPIA
jgi:hypothetical protein